MNFPQAIKSCFSKYATFSGRAARSEYWYWCLFVTLANIIITIIDNIIFNIPFEDEKALHPISLTFVLITLLPSFAVWVRRTHDINRSGWWLLILFIPLIGAIVLLIWSCMRGTIGENRFGSDPLEEVKI